MDAKLKRKWVKALRSGEHKQARGRLKNSETGGLCCIGVGVLVADKEFDVLNAPTTRAAIRLGLSATEQGVLIDMNDYQRRTFKTIAAYIEQNL